MGYLLLVVQLEHIQMTKSYFIADFAKRKKKPEEEKQEELKKGNQPRPWNNWEKAREVRSSLSTGQRLSQDVRGWMNMAQRLSGK